MREGSEHIESEGHCSGWRTGSDDGCAGRVLTASRGSCSLAWSRA